MARAARMKKETPPDLPCMGGVEDIAIIFFRFLGHAAHHTYRASDGGEHSD